MKFQYNLCTLLISPPLIAINTRFSDLTKHKQQAPAMAIRLHHNETMFTVALTRSLSVDQVILVLPCVQLPPDTLSVHTS